MSIKNFISILTFLSITFQVFGQATFRISSQLYYDNSNIHEYDNGDVIFLNNFGKYALYNPSIAHAFPVLSRVNSSGELLWSKTYESAIHPPLNPMQLHNFLVSENQELYSFFGLHTQDFEEVSGIFKSSPTGNFLWFTEIPRPGTSPNTSVFLEENTSSEEIFAFFSHNLKLGFARLDYLGNLTQNYGVRIIRNQNQLDIFTQYEDLLKSSQGNFHACGAFREESLGINQMGFIHKVDQLGQTISILTINNFSITAIRENNNGNLILSGYFVQDGSNYYPGLIILDSEENFLTSRIFLSEEFKEKNITFDLDANGNFILFFQEYENNFSSIIKLDEDFNPIWTRVYPGGYNGINSIIKVTSDQSLLFFTGLRDTITSHLTTILSKIDSLGNFPNLDAPEFCYQDPIEIIFEVNEEDFSILSLDFLENQSFELVNQDQVTTTEEPPTIVYPTPFFNFPDTLCADQCTSPTSLENEHADSQNWYSQGTETEIHESKNPGQLCWETPGTYQIQQIISFQNCLDTFEQFITIVPEIETTLPDTLIFCNDEEINIDGTSENALNYLWSTGETSTVITTNQSGLYILSADNQHCSFVDSVFVQINGTNYDLPTIILPKDTILCPENLPLEISVDLPYSDNGIWEDGSDSNPRMAYDYGDFTFTTEVNGCMFSETVTLSEKDCRAKIYLPNAFSPNDDGINDIFEPQGNGFEVSRFTIYNRWGALIFSNIAAPWDGKFKGQKLDSDVFVYVMEWRNTETNETGIEKGSVQLIR